MPQNYLRHIVVLFRRVINNVPYETIIDANPSSEHFPHVNFDLTIESDNPYPTGSVSITNIHELGVAALPGGICVIRAGYYEEGLLPPVIYAGRPFSIETHWHGTDSTTTIGLGLPSELFVEAYVAPLKVATPVRQVLNDQGGSRIQFDDATLQSELVDLNRVPIFAPK